MIVNILLDFEIVFDNVLVEVDCEFDVVLVSFLFSVNFKVGNSVFIFNGCFVGFIFFVEDFKFEDLEIFFEMECV